MLAVKAKVFGPHHGFDLGSHQVVTEHRTYCTPKVFGSDLIIPGNRVAVQPLDVCCRAERGSDVGGNLLDPLDAQFAGCVMERAECADEQGFVGNDVVGSAGPNLADRYDNRVQRRNITRRDCLERQHNVACHDYRVDAKVGHGRVAALAPNRDFESIGRCEERPLRVPRCPTGKIELP